MIYNSFKGFETRGTYMARRQTTWKNLIEASRPSGPFVLNPNEWLIQQNVTRVKKTKKKNKKKPKVKIILKDRHLLYSILFLDIYC